MNKYGELMQLAIELNSDDFVVMIDYHGHVKCVDARVYIGGFDAKTKADFSDYCHTGDKSGKGIDKMARTIKDLHKFKDLILENRNQIAA